VLSQSSFYSASDLRLHFGLGRAEAADLEIRWPRGTKETVAHVAANHLVMIREGSGIVKMERFTGARASAQGDPLLKSNRQKE
jgi:hypothetical protein